MTTSSKTYHKTAIIVGVLFIIATAFLFIGGAFYGPVLDTPDFLEVAYPQRIQAVIGILIEFVCVLAIPLIAIFAFPVLKRYSLPLAISLFTRLLRASAWSAGSGGGEGSLRKPLTTLSTE